MNVTFRPLSSWPGGDPKRGRRSPFLAGWSDTYERLQRELGHLGVRHVVVELALEERDIRLDGWPRAHAQPRHHGVVVSFDSKHGPLRYATAEFDHWQDNLRAIALGLEALRRVDRYGITRRGEQYRGWRALPAGDQSDERLAVIEHVERGRELIRKHGGVAAAMKATHPDHGGDAEDLRAVLAARDEEASR
jgi:hypothetical protein